MERLSGLDFWSDSEGFNPDVFRAAMDFLDQVAMGLFPETLEGQLDALRFKWQILGDAAGTAAEQFQELLDALQGIDGAEPFVAALERALAEGGPEAANAFIDALAARVAAGDQSLFGQGGLFFGLSPDDVARILEEGNSLIEDWLSSQGAGGASHSVQIGRSITEIQAVEVVAWLEDIAFTLRDMRALMQLSQGLVSNTASLGAAMAAQPSAISQAAAMVASGPGNGGDYFDFRGASIHPSVDEDQVDRTSRALAAAIRRAKATGKVT